MINWMRRVLIFGIIAILQWSIVTPLTNPLCSTPACQKTAHRMLSWMNDSVDPCEDFHEFACGGFPRLFNGTDDIGINALTLAKKRHSELLKGILSNNSTLLNRPSTEGDMIAMKKAQAFYSSCRREPDIKHNITHSPSLSRVVQQLATDFFPIAPYVNDTIDRNALAKVLAYLHKAGTNSIFELGWLEPEDGQKDSKNNITIVVEPLTKGFLSRMSVKNPPVNGLVHNISLHLQMNGPSHLQQPNMTELALQVFQFQISLIGALFVNETSANNSSQVNNTSQMNSTNNEAASSNTSDSPEEYVSVAALGSAIKSFDFLTYLYEMFPRKRFLTIINGQTSVPLDRAKYLIRMDEVLVRTHARTLEAYLTLTHILYLTSVIDMDSTNTALQSDKSFMPEEVCSLLSFNYFDKIIAKYMIPAFIKKTSRARVEVMVESLKKSFEKRILALTWLDTQTKEQALKKLWAIGHNIGYPSSLASPTLGFKTYRDIKIHRLDYYRNLVNVRTDMNQKEIIGMAGKRDRREWRISASAVNAYYDLRTNQIFVPAGILQSPTFGTHQPSYLNYGAIGFIIGHELTHAFDVQGATRNAQGQQVNWWSNSTMARFSNKTQCMIDQYSNYTLSFTNATKSVNGKATLGENMADNGGLARAYEAWKIQLDDPSSFASHSVNIKGLERFSDDQLFFLSFAQVWCHVRDYNPAGQDSKKLDTDVHSPERYRVNGAVSNSVQFAKTWQCRGGQRMHPFKKCVVW